MRSLFFYPPPNPQVLCQVTLAPPPRTLLPPRRPPLPPRRPSLPPPPASCAQMPQAMPPFDSTLRASCALWPWATGQMTGTTTMAWRIARTESAACATQSYATGPGAGHGPARGLGSAECVQSSRTSAPWMSTGELWRWTSGSPARAWVGRALEHLPMSLYTRSDGRMLLLVSLLQLRLCI